MNAWENGNFSKLPMMTGINPLKSVKTLIFRTNQSCEVSLIKIHGTKIFKYPVRISFFIKILFKNRIRLRQYGRPIPNGMLMTHLDDHCSTNIVLIISRLSFTSIICMCKSCMYE